MMRTWRWRSDAAASGFVGVQPWQPPHPASPRAATACPDVDALEYLVIDEPVRPGSQAEMGAELISRAAKCAFRGSSSVMVTTFASPISVSSKRCSSTARPFGRRGVGSDLADPQVIVLEHLEAALLLHAVMLALRAPADHRFLVAPGRERQQATLGALALEALVVDEAVDRLELRLQVLGELEIVVQRSFFGCTSKMTANMGVSSRLPVRRWLGSGATVVARQEGRCSRDRARSASPRDASDAWRGRS